jgi:hypothetical protein
MREPEHARVARQYRATTEGANAPGGSERHPGDSAHGNRSRQLGGPGRPGDRGGRPADGRGPAALLRQSRRPCSGPLSTRLAAIRSRPGAALAPAKRTGWDDLRATSGNRSGATGGCVRQRLHGRGQQASDGNAQSACQVGPEVPVIPTIAGNIAQIANI